MDPKQLFFDDRIRDLCVFCGAKPNTRDHVPSLVLLDTPYPSELPVVPACKVCNEAFSLDEQYLACLVDCAISGSTRGCSRSKVRRQLDENPLLAARLSECRRVDENGVSWWQPEMGRVMNVVLKLARGHFAFENSEPMLDVPRSLSVVPVALMTYEEEMAYEAPVQVPLWPDLGSRAFIGQAKMWPQQPGWRVVQEGRYWYSAGTPGCTLVRFVLSEYLACTVAW